MTKNFIAEAPRQTLYLSSIWFRLPMPCLSERYSRSADWRIVSGNFLGTFMAPVPKLYTLSHASSFKSMSTVLFSQSAGGHPRLKMCLCHGTERNDFPGTCIFFESDTRGTYQFTSPTIRCNYGWRSIKVSVQASFSALSLAFQQISSYCLLFVSTKAFVIHWETRHRPVLYDFKHR